MQCSPDTVVGCSGSRDCPVCCSLRWHPAEISPYTSLIRAHEASDRGTAVLHGSVEATGEVLAARLAALHSESITSKGSEVPSMMHWPMAMPTSSCAAGLQLDPLQRYRQLGASHVPPLAFCREMAEATLHDTRLHMDWQEARIAELDSQDGMQTARRQASPSETCKHGVECTSAGM